MDTRALSRFILQPESKGGLDMEAFSEYMKENIIWIAPVLTALLGSGFFVALWDRRKKKRNQEGSDGKTSGVTNNSNSSGNSTNTQVPIELHFYNNGQPNTEKNSSSQEEKIIPTSDTPVVLRKFSSPSEPFPNCEPASPQSPSPVQQTHFRQPPSSAPVDLRELSAPTESLPDYRPAPPQPPPPMQQTQPHRSNPFEIDPHNEAFNSREYIEALAFKLGLTREVVLTEINN